MKCHHMVLRHIISKDIHKECGYIYTPCGICENCRKNFAHMWGTRVFHESLDYDKSVFVTITYSPDNLPTGSGVYPTIDIADVQKFLKSVREYIYPDKIRYFCGCEYSPQNHLPHYHMAIFGIDLWDRRVFINHVPRDGGYSVDCRFWKKGYVHVGNLEQGSANYIAGYALKKVMGSKNKDYYKNLGITPPRALMSRNPGIGARFMERWTDVMRRLGSTTVNGTVVALPRYYRDKIDFKNSDKYKELQDEQAKMMYDKWLQRSNMTFEELQQSIIDRQNLERQYDWIEKRHAELQSANERCLK